jgi:ZIP family zinc transporter
MTAGPLLGSLLGIIKMLHEGFMYNMLSFAAGVMLAISFLELIPESIKLTSVWLAATGIALGSVMMHLLDKLVPHIHPALCRNEHGSKIEKTAFFLFVGIFLHNFPEGMAVGLGLVRDFHLSLTVALAIAVHDIPETLCTSVPYYFATKRRVQTLLVSLSTAVPSMAGFAFSYLVFQDISMTLVGLIIAGTAGLMIYISADELIPTSCANWEPGAIFSLMAGVIFVVLLGTV